MPGGKPAGAAWMLLLNGAGLGRSSLISDFWLLLRNSNLRVIKINANYWILFRIAVVLQQKKQVQLQFFLYSYPFKKKGIL